MSKTLINQLKERLEKDKETLEKELTKIAKKDKRPEGDWDTRFPQWDGDSGSSALERAANQVEEYGNLLSLEYALETRLKDVNLALEKIKKGAYGRCEKCKKNIAEARLKANPAAKTCSKCQ